MSTYTLIPTPSGDYANIYDMQAIRMAALHNVLIRSFNSIVIHAPNIEPTDVPSFMKYCQSVAAMVRQHHTTKQAVIFPFLETKLGKDSTKIDASDDFLPKLNEWSQLCQSVQLGNEQFGAPKFVAVLRQSTDLLVNDLVDEMAIFESSKLKLHFSESELKSLEPLIDNNVREHGSLWDMPLLLVNGDIDYNPWFPNAPNPMLFILRHAIMRLGGDMWKYGQSDKYCKLKPEFRSMYGL
ncbi:hypothetical protein BDV93DRAFT_586253 [Ceratobasidium sp. AG-I]|nr:hypothetical protein BDV93DRAFT_586253 [Ceratobasidium sp. AG-I]